MLDVLLPALLHGLPDAVIATDAADVVRVWNPSAVRLCGLDERDAVGRRLDDLVGGGLARGRLRRGEFDVAVDVDVVCVGAAEDADGDDDAGDDDAGLLRRIFIAREARARPVSLIDRLSLAEPLPPRLRDTLAGLVEGLSEKQIAARHDLSPHTVHDYVKALHRRLGVQSRAELVALVLRAAVDGSASSSSSSSSSLVLPRR